MTKRALSLLLTLVMVLSLCVPALAAEEFEAEAPAEVVEEAPEAPEAPVEPEAEEPAEEPVVDEPAAEEPVEVVEDVPEMASLIPEELTDEPLLVAMGVVSNKAHWDLYKAVKAAEAIMPDVEAGKVYAKGFDPALASFDLKKYDPEDPTTHPLYKATADFMKAYETAKDYLDAVNGKDVDYEVVTDTVQAAATDLLQYVLGGSKELIADIASTDAANMTNARLLGMVTANADTTYDTSSAIASPAPVTGTGGLDTSNIKTSADVDKAIWKKSYQASYLTELKAAIDAANKFDNMTYKSFADAVNTILDAITSEAKGARPSQSDMSALDAAITKAETANKTYEDEVDKYVLGADYTTGLQGLIDTAKGLKSPSGGLNGFDTKATYFAYNDIITKINDATKLKESTINVVASSVKLASSNESFDFMVSVSKFGGTVDKNGSTNVKGDGKTYGYAYKIGNKWVNFKDTSASGHFAGDTTIDSYAATATNKFIAEIPNNAWETNDRYDGVYVQKLSSNSNLSTDGSNVDKFGVNNTVTVQFFEKIGDGSTATWKTVGSPKTISMSNNYVGPVVKKAVIASGDYKDSTAKITSYTKGSFANDDSSLSTLTALTTDTSNHVDVEVTMTDSTAMTSLNYRFNVMNASNQIITYPTHTSDGTVVGMASTGVSSSKATLDKMDSYLVAGSVLKIQLAVATNATTPAYGDYIPQGTPVTLTVEPLSKWQDVPTIKTILADANKMVASDYKFKTLARPDDATTVADVISAIKRNVTLINKDLDDATKANSVTNRNTVITNLVNTALLRSYIEIDGPDHNDLDALIAEARELLATKKSEDYTFDSWGALNDLVDSTIAVSAIAKAEKLQSTTDEYQAKVEAAIAALKGEAEPDKTSLNSSIAAAKALKEEDYTKESWAAAKAEIDAALATAETVAANETATQAQIDAAKAALDAAVAKLVKASGEEEPTGPKAPSSGTGWTTYNGDIYFFKNGTMVKNFWVGNAVGASKWANNWYYVGSDGKLATGLQYIDDLKGGKAWYMLQVDNTNGEIGKMLTGWQWTYSAAGTGYFSPKYGSQGMCTYTSEWGSYNASTGLWADGLAHR